MKDTDSIILDLANGKRAEVDFTTMTTTVNAPSTTSPCTIAKMRETMAELDRLAGEATAIEQALKSWMRAQGFDPDKGGVLVLPSRYRSPGLPPWVRFSDAKHNEGFAFLMFDPFADGYWHRIAVSRLSEVAPAQFGADADKDKAGGK